MKEQTAPKYKQLKEQILSWIMTGQYQPHDQLISENEMSKKYELSRQTVRQALGELVQEGWLYREQGKGTFVSELINSDHDDRQFEALHEGARERRRQSSGLTIGMITTHISDYIFPMIVRGVVSTLQEKGAKLLLASTDNEKEKEKQSLESMMREQLSGLIIEPTKSAEGNPNFDYFLTLNKLNIPYVMLNEKYSDVVAPCLRIDDELGGYLAAEHLLSLGHKRIAGFFKTDDFQGIHRMRGFIRAHREFSLPVTPELIVRYSTEEKKVKPVDQLSVMLQRGSEERPTAIVCYNDELAVLLLDVIRDHAIIVPEQLSIVGFDDANLATATEVKLTTVAHPKTAMGVDAAELLCQMLDKRSKMFTEDKVYEPTLIIRASTCPPSTCEGNIKK